MAGAEFEDEFDAALVLANLELEGDRLPVVRPGERVRAARARKPYARPAALCAYWAPRVLPGEYTVRLSVGGKTYSQPLSLRLDPRVTTPAEDLARNAELSMEMYTLARDTRIAYGQARDLAAEVGKAASTAGLTREAFATDLDGVAPPEAKREEWAPPPREIPATLNGVSEAALDACMAMQAAETTPTAVQIAASDRARSRARVVMARWEALKSKGLVAFNARLQRKGAAAVPLPLPRAPAALPSDANGNEMEE